MAAVAAAAAAAVVGVPQSRTPTAAMTAGAAATAAVVGVWAAGAARETDKVEAEGACVAVREAATAGGK